MWDLSEIEMKAYMTNAELIQNAIDNKDNRSENGKKTKISKKKLKNKNKTQVEHSDSSELVSSEDTLDVLKENPPDSAKKEVEFFNENDVDEEEDDENTEFNAIFFFMSVPNRLKQRYSNNFFESFFIYYYSLDSK